MEADPTPASFENAHVENLESTHPIHLQQHTGAKASETITPKAVGTAALTTWI